MVANGTSAPDAASAAALNLPGGTVTEPADTSAADVSAALEFLTEEHTRHFGELPSLWASAPAGWFVIGEHSDAAGGVVVSGLSQHRATVTVTPRNDQVVRVHYVDASAATNAEAFDVDDARVVDSDTTLPDEQPFGAGTPTFVHSAATDAARRIAGLMATAAGRQLIAREARGADITVHCTIPEGMGLGERAAVECATVLALAMHTKDRDEAPIRARLVDVAVSAAASYSPEPPLKARYTAIMRGRANAFQVVDYRDGSLTQAPHVLDAGYQPIVVAVPGRDNSVDVSELRQRMNFAHDASKAFGVESLRHLPDAAPRVTAWLAAMHGAQRGEGLPSAQQASAWLDFFDAETSHAEDFVNLVRSRRQASALVAVDRSRDALASAVGVPATSTQLAELAAGWGAHAARPACVDITDAIIAYVPAADAEQFLDSAHGAGLLAIPLMAASESAR